MFIAGEGPNELGPPPHPRPGPPGAIPAPGQGVIEAFLAKTNRPGWTVVGRAAWRDVRKLVPNSPDAGDRRTVLGLALMAKERGCRVLAFLRDRDDGVPGGGIARQRAIEQAVREVPTALRHAPDVAGGVPVRKLEAWLLALAGNRASEQVTDPVAELSRLCGIVPKQTTVMVEFVRNADLRRMAGDAASLRRWLRVVFVCLQVRPPAFL